MVQDPVGSRACRVNSRFEGSSPSRSAFAVMAQLVQHEILSEEAKKAGWKSGVMNI